MRFELDLADGFRLVDRTKGEEIRLRGNASVLICLALADHAVARDEVCARVWPDAAVHVARNRLRVALSKLRVLLPNAIAESPSGLSLNPHVVSVDVWTVRELLKDAENTVRIVDELQTIVQAAQMLGARCDLRRLRLLGAEFASALGTAWLRGVELADSIGRPDDSTFLGRLATRTFPADPRAWVALLTTSWKTQSLEEAVLRLRNEAPEMMEHPEVKAALKQARSPHPSGSYKTSRDERSLVVELFEHLEESRRDLWRSLLSSPQSLALAGKYPRQMHDLLERAIAEPVEPKDADWERCMGRLIGLKAWQNDAEGVLALAPRILEVSRDPHILRATWNTVAIAHSLRNEWEAAFLALDKTAKYANESGNVMNELTVAGVRAYFLMQQGHSAEALSAYDEMLRKLKEIDTPHARFETAVGMGHRAFAPLFADDWAQAANDLEAALSVRSELGVQMGQLQAALALAYRFLGRSDGVVQLVRAALLDAFESDSEVGLQWTFELVAGVLCLSQQRSYGLAVLGWVTEWRNRTGHKRRPAEEHLCGVLQKLAANSSPVVRLDQESAAPEIGREAMRRLRLGLRPGA